MFKLLLSAGLPFWDSYLYSFFNDSDKSVREKASEMFAEYGPQGNAQVSREAHVFVP